MMLAEQTTTPSAALPVAELRDHLRLGTGFGTDSVQDALIENLLRAALAAIEGRTGKALLSRAFVWTLTGWRDGDMVGLPLAPVSEITALRVVSRDGSETVIPPTNYQLVRDLHRPLLKSLTAALPTIPTGGTAEVAFVAGFGATWGDLPPDLAHAVLLLAAHYHEHRHNATGDQVSEIPFGVGALIQRYRNLRLSGEASR